MMTVMTGMRVHTRKENMSGQAFIEFLIVFPSLFLIFIGVMFFGKGYVTKVRVDMAVRYAAWRTGRSDGATPPEKLAEIYFPGESPAIETVDPGPPSIAGLPELEAVGAVFDALGDTVEAGLATGLKAPYFFSVPVRISAVHYVDVSGWGDKTSLTAAGLWGLAIARGFSSAKTPGLCYGNGVKAVLTPFAREYLEKKADEAVTSALESGIEAVGTIIVSRIEGWMDDVLASLGAGGTGGGDI